MTSKIQVFAKTLNGQTVSVHINPDDSIQDLKQLFQHKTGISVQDQNLIFSGKPLTQGTHKLKHYNIQNQSTIHMSLKVLGGGSLPIWFNSLQKQKLLQFTKKAPKYCVVRKGLNLQGQCNTPTCKAFHKLAWCTKGFGTFSINKLVYTSKCPLCQVNMINVNNFGIIKATMKITGMMKGQSEEFTKVYEKDKNGLLTFENSDETQREWLYLEVQVREQGWEF